jgi:hypothetical protein
VRIVRRIAESFARIISPWFGLRFPSVALCPVAVEVRRAAGSPSGVRRIARR